MKRWTYILHFMLNNVLTCSDRRVIIDNSCQACHLDRRWNTRQGVDSSGHRRLHHTSGLYSIAIGYLSTYRAGCRFRYALCRYRFSVYRSISAFLLPLQIPPLLGDWDSLHARKLSTMTGSFWLLRNIFIS